MNGPSVRLNERKRFVCAAAVAAVLIILASGAKALANTVRCVPSLAVNPSCAVAYAHIQDAVGAASDFDVIVVGPGYYNESVLVQESNLPILGAQAGKDARVDRWNPANESIVDATNQVSTTPPAGSGAAFLIEVPNVVIDGFTIEGGGVVTSGTPGPAACGVAVAAPGAQILNNIIQNNALGVFVNGLDSLVEYNLFKTNNAGAAGEELVPFGTMAGFAVAVVGSTGAAITENEFEGNGAAAVDLVDATAALVTNNTSEKDGALVAAHAGTACFISQNQGRDFCPKLPLPIAGLPADAAIDLGGGGGNNSFQINDNDLEEGSTKEYSGIAFTTIFGSGACLNCQVSNNTVKGFAGNGIVAETTTPLPGIRTLEESVISGNDVERNGNDGILIEESLGNILNSLVDNKAQGNHLYDCEDDTYVQIGPGTAGTYNSWFNNIGSLSDPPGLCAPRTW